MLLLHVAVLGFQMLEGFWVVATLVRFTGKLSHQWPDYAHGGIAALGVYICAMMLIIILGFWLVMFGVVLVIFQLTYVGELIVMTSWLRG